MGQRTSIGIASGIPHINAPPGMRLRLWPGEPGTAQLVLYNQPRPPAAHELTALIAELADSGVRAVRTGALHAAYAESMLASGFRPRQQLTLLEHNGPFDWVGPLPGGMQRLLRPITSRAGLASHSELADVDHLAFAAPWQLDVEGIRDVVRATPSARQRLIRDGDRVVAFALSGRDRFTGYLQRLSVHPDSQRRGLGRALVADSLQWMWRHGVYRALVNTHVGNEPALALYRSVGFTRLTDPLTVYERAVP
jgi:GNAT superfamily N-acetyltransferase